MDEEGNAVPEKTESVANGGSIVESKAEGKTEAQTDKKAEEYTGLKDMEEDSRNNVEVETQKVDKDEVVENMETDEAVEDVMVKKQGIADKEKCEVGHMESEEAKTEKMDEDVEEKFENIRGDKVEDENDEAKEEGENMEELKKGKGLKAHAKPTTGGGKKDKGNKSDHEEKTKDEEATPTQKVTKDRKTSSSKKPKEQKGPTPPTIERPVRERKSVERLVATYQRDLARDFHVAKGRGTALKDIPNVAYKLSKKKTDDTLKLLHTILFGKRGKAAEIKNNISRFSGYVFHDNEEKQINKVREKLDKCVKEKLVEFCDVFDIAVAKANTRKEDIIAKLIEFLVEPQATTSELLAEKEQSSKGKKRKRASKSESGSSKASKGSAKKKEGAKADKTGSEMRGSDDESGDEKEEGEEEGDEDANDIPESGDDGPSEGDGSEEKESEIEDQSEENKGKKKHGSKKSYAQKESAEKTPTKKKAIPKTTSPSQKAAAKSPPSGSKKVSDENIAKKSSGKEKDEATSTKESLGKKKKDDSTTAKESSRKKGGSAPAKKSSGKGDDSTSSKKSSRKKKDALTTETETSGKNKEELAEKSSAPKKTAKESTGLGAKVMKVKDKLKAAEKSKPNDNELRHSIVEILKEVDFNTATFTDILKLLAKKYSTDFTPRKSAIKIMIQEELTKLAEAEEVADKGNNDDAEKEKQPSTKDVKA